MIKAASHMIMAIMTKQRSGGCGSYTIIPVEQTRNLMAI